MRNTLSCILIIHSFIGFSQMMRPEVGLRNHVVLYPETIRQIDRGTPSSHLLLNDEDRVSTKLVSYFQTEREYYMVHKFDDLGYIEMLRTESGPISVFEFSKEIYDPYPGGTGKSVNNYEFYLFNSELKPLNHENLKRDLQHDQQSVDMINRRTKKNYLRAGVFTGGLVLAVVGINKMFVPDPGGVRRFEFTPNFPFIAGIPVMALSISLGKNKQHSLRNIIITYNLNHSPNR